MHDLACVSRVGAVLHRSCEACHDDRCRMDEHDLHRDVSPACKRPMINHVMFRRFKGHLSNVLRNESESKRGCVT